MLLMMCLHIFKLLRLCSRGLAAWLVPASSEKGTEGEEVMHLFLTETPVRPGLHLASYGQDRDLAIPRSTVDSSCGG